MVDTRGRGLLTSGGPFTRPRGGLRDGGKLSVWRCLRGLIYSFAVLMLSLNLFTLTSPPGTSIWRLWRANGPLGRQPGARQTDEDGYPAVELLQHPISQASGELDCNTEGGGQVHVMYTCDSNEYQALLASIVSALRNSKDPGRLRFHIILPVSMDKRAFCSMLLAAMVRTKGRWCKGGASPSYLPSTKPVPACPVKISSHTPKKTKKDRGTKPGEQVDKSLASCMCSSEQFHVVSFDSEEFLEPLQEIQQSLQSFSSPDGETRRELMGSINFARNFADDVLLPYGVDKVAYLDVDTIVQGDIVDLIDNTNFTAEKFFAASGSCTQKMQDWFNFKEALIRRTMRKRDCYMNAGVYAVNLRSYKKADIQNKIMDLIRHNQRRKLWVQGVQQPSFILALYNHSIRLDKRWNTAGLGWRSDLEEKELKRAHVLHWTGSHKPWNCDGYWQSIWDPYAVTYMRDTKDCLREAQQQQLQSGRGWQWSWHANLGRSKAAIDKSAQLQSARDAVNHKSSALQWVKDRTHAVHHLSEKMMATQSHRHVPEEAQQGPP